MLRVSNRCRMRIIVGSRNCARSQHGMDITVLRWNFFHLTNMNWLETSAYVPHFVLITTSEFAVERAIGFPLYRRGTT